MAPSSRLDRLGGILFAAPIKKTFRGASAIYSETTGAVDVGTPTSVLGRPDHVTRGGSEVSRNFRNLTHALSHLAGIMSQDTQ